jgi:hypothetical protein
MAISVIPAKPVLSVVEGAGIQKCLVRPVLSVVEGLEIYFVS